MTITAEQAGEQMAIHINTFFDRLKQAHAANAAKISTRGKVPQSADSKIQIIDSRRADQ